MYISQNFSILAKLFFVSLLFLALLGSGVANASLMRAELTGTVTYIDGSSTNERIAKALAGLVTAGDSVSMFMEYDPTGYTAMFPSGSYNIFQNVVGKWGIDFNNSALVVSHDPAITTVSHNLAWITTGSSSSFFNVVDHAALQSGRNTGIQGTHFEPTDDYFNDWIPLQVVQYFSSLADNSVIPNQPQFTHTRFDYVASRMNSNQQIQNSQSGISVRWDRVLIVDDSQPMPAPAPVWLLLPLITGLAGSRYFKKSA